ncbi:MAG: hypothetical protein QM664_10465 [Flavihumibacter sp.]
MKSWGLALLLLVSMVQGVKAIRWTGGAGSSRWDDPANWEDARLPGPADEVILDNRYVSGSYQVLLPDVAVSVGHIRMVATAGAEILLLLPPTNLLAGAAGDPAAIALQLTGSGYVLDIENGCSFINASGAASGYALWLNDSISVRNGGRYIHRSRTGHAAIVDKLSRMPGTAQGVFRFENTDAASVISLSGRVFGRLELSAAYAPDRQVAYTAAGTSNALIRSDLVLEEGVRFAFNFSDTIRILGNLEGRQAVLNLASAARSLTLAIRKDIYWENGSIGAVNTNAATGLLLLAGDRQQQVSVNIPIGAGTTLALDNIQGCRSTGDLAVTHMLELKNGPLLLNEGSRLLLGPSAVVLCDSLNQHSYVEGIIRKAAWSGAALRFPVGKNNRQRWIQLAGGAGDIEVAYYAAPSPGHPLAPGLDQVSALEYWSVLLPQPSPVQVSLSFAKQPAGY